MFVDFVFVLNVEFCFFFFPFKTAIHQHRSFFFFFFPIQSASGKAANDCESSRIALCCPIPTSSPCFFNSRKMAWLLEQSSAFGDLAIKLDFCITLAAF